MDSKSTAADALVAPGTHGPPAEAEDAHANGSAPDASAMHAPLGSPQPADAPAGPGPGDSVTMLPAGVPAAPEAAPEAQPVGAARATAAQDAPKPILPPFRGADWGTSAAGERHNAAARPTEPVSCAASDFELAWSLMPRSNKRAAAERAAAAVHSAALWEGAPLSRCARVGGAGVGGGKGSVPKRRRTLSREPPLQPRVARVGAVDDSPESSPSAPGAAAAPAAAAHGGEEGEAEAGQMVTQPEEGAAPRARPRARAKGRRGRARGAAPRAGAAEAEAAEASARQAEAGANGDGGGVAEGSDGEEGSGSDDASGQRGHGRGGRGRRASDAAGARRRVRAGPSVGALANRLLQLGEDPYFRTEVCEWSKEGGLSVQWAFPGGNAGDCNAWVGLFAEEGCDWAASAPRPPYAKFKQIVENKSHGVKRFSGKEVRSLHDGTYFASLHAGDFSYATAGPGYCVSQRIVVADGEIRALIGRAYAALVPASRRPDDAPPPSMGPMHSLEARSLLLSSGGAQLRVSIAFDETLPEGAPAPDGAPAAAGAPAAGAPGAAAGAPEAAAAAPGSAAEGVPAAPGAERGAAPAAGRGSGPAGAAVVTPVVHLELPASYESAALKRVYRVVDALSFLDWGLCSDDIVAGCKRRAATEAAERQTWGGGELVVPLAAAGGTAHRPLRAEPLTTRTSEHYGEATMATVERLLLTLEHLNEVVPCMRGWGPMWNLSADSTLVDIGSGYGKVVLHAKLRTDCRRSVGIECVTARHLIAEQALDKLASEQGDAERAADALAGVQFLDADATHFARLDFSHVYVFDRVFSKVTLSALAAVLQRSDWFVLVSSKPARVWWECGLRKAHPVCRLRFVTTGKERCTCTVFINAQLALPPSRGM